MSQVRKALPALKAAMLLAGCEIPRLALSTSDAVSLAEDVIASGGALRHGDKVVAAVVTFRDLVDLKTEPGSDAAIKQGELIAKMADEFWSHFEAESIDGIEILRKRA